MQLCHPYVDADILLVDVGFGILVSDGLDDVKEVGGGAGLGVELVNELFDGCGKGCFVALVL